MITSGGEKRRTSLPYNLLLQELAIIVVILLWARSLSFDIVQVAFQFFDFQLLQNNKAAQVLKQDPQQYCFLHFRVSASLHLLRLIHRLITPAVGDQMQSNMSNCEHKAGGECLPQLGWWQVDCFFSITSTQKAQPLQVK